MPVYRPNLDPEPVRDLLRLKPVERETDHLPLSLGQIPAQPPSTVHIIPPLGCLGGIPLARLEAMLLDPPFRSHTPLTIGPQPDLEDVSPAEVLAYLLEGVLEGKRIPQPPPLRLIPPSSQDESVVGGCEALIPRHGDATAESEAGRPLGDLEIKRGEDQ